MKTAGGRPTGGEQLVGEFALRGVEERRRGY
jgi:hypothetical protein